jgi:curved DNA-binding protein CbpA
MENIKRMENQFEKSKLKILNETDPYKIIGVDDSASLEEINKNYKELAKEFHPDRHSNLFLHEKKEIEVLFTKITTAFNLLKDTEERNKFDYEKRMRLRKEETLNEIKSAQATRKLNPHQTQPGGIDISSLFTDNKVDSTSFKQKKAENLFNNSVSKYNKGELDSAIADLQSAIELNGSNARYHSSLALIMKEKGWNGYAMAEFKIALSLDPNDNLAMEHYKSLTANNNGPSNSPAEKKEKPENSIFHKVKNLFKKS